MNYKTMNEEIDPTEQEYSIENRWKNNQTNAINKLCKFEDADEWICYRTWKTGSNEYDHSVKGMGNMSVETVDLDQEFMVDYIREEAHDLIESDEYAQIGKQLDNNIVDIVDTVVDEWAMGVEEVIMDAAYSGLLSLDGTIAWVSHVEEAYYNETQAALVAIDDPDGVAHDIVQQSLAEAVRKHRNRWRNPHAEYIGALRFDSEH